MSRLLKDYEMKEIKTKTDLIDAIVKYKEITQGKGSIIFFDTETTGLNIRYDTPFLIPWGFIDYKNEKAYIYVCDIDVDAKLFKQTCKVVVELSKDKGLCGHNTKYDIHMLNNIGVETPDEIHYMDTMIYIRLAHDALTPENGGPPLGLKEYCVKYIDRSAKDNEHIVASLRTDMSKKYNRDLKDRLYKIDKKYTAKYLDEYFKDVLHNANTLEPRAREVYLEWLETIPEQIRKNMTTGRVESSDIPYNLVDRKVVKKYSMFDILWTMEIYLQCDPIVYARHTDVALRYEEPMIKPLVRMEECGFQINKPYVYETVEVLSDYLRQQRNKIFELTGEVVKVNQNAKIKDLLIDRYNLSVNGTGKEDLNRIYDELKVREPDSDVVKFIGLVQELRTLEKWYKTYLLRFVREIEQGHDRIYTQINQVGTVSGRVTSDFQQFPKYGINKDDGTHLFHPRRMITTTPGYKGLAYLDYSQVELRLQALYTILVGSPDLNLCRAYMPYKCVLKDGTLFNYENPEHIKHAYDWEWFYEEEPDKEWVATDVHAATTHVAFPDLDMHSDEFKKLRGKVGKKLNFAKNYGAQFNKIKTMFPDYDDETIHRIDDAYYTAFPGVKKYHEYCYTQAQLSPYMTNLFGVRYYGLSGHKAINCLVQGSGAYLLKGRIKAVDEFIQSHNLKSKIQMQIHDELSYEVYPGEEQYVMEFKRIMQEFDDSMVPIVADLEFTATTWADKKEYENMEEVLASE